MENTNKKLLVIDSSCVLGCNRTHEVMIDGAIRKIEFIYGEETVLDFAIGMKFNKEGFILKDIETGSDILLPPTTDDTVRMRIGSDEVVAKYDEVTVTALKVRASALAGGEKYLIDEVERDDIIAFLKSPKKVFVKEAETSSLPVEDDESDLDFDINTINTAVASPIPEFSETIIFDDESAVEEV